MKNLLLALLLAVSATTLVTHAHAQLVIANSSIKSASISKADLKDVFTGLASNLKDGSRVTPVLMNAGPTTNEFLAAYIGKADTPFRAGWHTLVFSGQVTMPKSFDSDAAVVAHVAQTPGAIGYISKSAPHDGVKILEVH